MDPSSPFSGYEFDTSNCHNLSIEEKREIIHQLSKSPATAAEKVKNWSRQDLVEILCAEKGKERKYNSLTKHKLIENLFKVVSKKKSQLSIEDTDSMLRLHSPMSKKKCGEHKEDTDSMLHLHSPSSPPYPQPSSKRQRKTDHPSRLPIVTCNLPANNVTETQKSTQYCLNIACRAIVSPEYAFCKRCSCCICHKFDDNKDPSLWLVCSSEAPSEGVPCGLSCHLDCAFKHERTGILKNGPSTRLDGSYYCTYCLKVNDLLRCWRKQLMIAKDARRVDVLCYRVSLSHKLLSLTTKYQELHAIVHKAKKLLESEVGLLSGLPSMTRGIVNRLSVGAEVQKLCACAVESLDFMLFSALAVDAQMQNPSSAETRPTFVKFEFVSPTSVTLVLGPENDPSLPPDLVGITLWLRKADVSDYLTEPTHTLVKAEGRFLISDLTPATEYVIRIIAFNNTTELGKWEVGVKTETTSRDIKNALGERTSTKSHSERQKIRSNSLFPPSSEGDESNSTNAFGQLNEVPNSISGYIDSQKSSGPAYKATNGAQNSWVDTTLTMQSTGQEGTPGNSGSALDEEPNSLIQTESNRDSTTSTEHNHNNMSDIPKSDNDSNSPRGNEIAIAPHAIIASTEPVTPCRLETGKEGSVRNCNMTPNQNLLASAPEKLEMEPGSSSKRRIGMIGEDDWILDCSAAGSYEYCVKVIRWLECEGHIETNFRVKLLTWFSLRATAQEKRVLNVYVNTLIDDPVSLAGQLMDTFSESVFSKRPSPVPNGFCNRLWH